MDDSDEEVFGRLYLSSRARLAAQIYGLTGDASEAAEVVQEAFSRAWANWGSLRSFDDPEAWVRKVAFRVAVSRWRRVRRLVSAPGGDDARIAAEPAAERVDVVRALADLPMGQRRAVVLHHLGGLAVAEVAEEMGVPEGTVKSWLSRGRSRLARHLGDPEVEHEEVQRWPS